MPHDRRARSPQSGGPLRIAQKQLKKRHTRERIPLRRLVPVQAHDEKLGTILQVSAAPLIRSRRKSATHRSRITNYYEVESIVPAPSRTPCRAVKEDPNCRSTVSPAIAHKLSRCPLPGTSGSRCKLLCKNIGPPRASVKLGKSRPFVTCDPPPATPIKRRGGTIPFSMPFHSAANVVECRQLSGFLDPSLLDL
jgi:hypothetical protein